MNPGTQAEEMVEVRLRYRPVGDVLTVSVRSGGPPGPRSRAELDDDTLVEWTRMPDGTGRLSALQLLGARSRRTDRSAIDHLPEALKEPALDLIDPGHRHHGHPSTHRPTDPTAVHETVVRTTTATLELPFPPPDEPVPPG